MKVALIYNETNIDPSDVINVFGMITKEHYSPKAVERVARAFVDLNRSIQDMPPQNSDGLLKSATCYQKPIYIQGMEPDGSLKNFLIETYYKPYHQNIQKSIRDLNLELCIDCHSMASHAPNISPDGKNNKRPSFCLSNQSGKTSYVETIELLADYISKVYSVKREEISLNYPFLGGYITRTYGNNPIPWIQIEMNRDLYLCDSWFDRESLTVQKSHLSNMNKKFAHTLELFFKYSLL